MTEEKQSMEIAGSIEESVDPENHMLELEETEDDGEKFPLEIEEEFDADVELEEVSKWSHVRTFLLGGALVIILAALAGLFYRFYPLPSKISGEWEASTVNGTYLIKNDGKKSTFVMENLNGVKGMDMSFESHLTAEAENEYFVKDTKVFLVLDREYIKDEAVKEIIGDGTNFEEVSKNKKALTLKYTTAGTDSAFGDEDLDVLFKYVLRDFGWGLKGKTLKLRNASFASGGLAFTKVNKD